MFWRFRFLSFFEKCLPSVPIFISCCFISCWWLGKANLENMFHFLSCSIFLDKELSTRGLEVVSSLSFFPLHEGFVMFLLLTVFAFHPLSLVSLKSMFLACQLFYTNFTFHSLSLQFSSFKTSVSHLDVVYLYCSYAIFKRNKCKFHIIHLFSII